MHAVEIQREGDPPEAEPPQYATAVVLRKLQ